MYEAMKFGREEFPVHLPDELIAAELQPNKLELEDMTVPQRIRYALDHPIDSAPLKEIVKPGETVCVIISDVTRRWQSPETYVPILIRELTEAGIKDEDILLLSATGTHRRQTVEEHVGLVTKEIYDRIRIEDHVCTDKEQLRFVGNTSRGTPVWLDKRALDCDHIIMTGGVVYHFMAGFGGGRKSVLPGIAGRETIMVNHNLALNPGLGNGINPNSHCANLTDDNPVHADMMEATAMAHPSFLINVVVNDNQEIIGAFAGNWVTAHRAACDMVQRMYGVPAKEKTPQVIASTGGYPKDLNFYQTVKTLCNVLEIIADKGTIILVTKSNEGFGSEDTRKQIADYPNMLEREKALRENFTIGGYIGFLFAQTSVDYNLIAVTDMEQKDFGSSQIHVVHSLDEALELSRKLNGGRDLRTTLMPHGGNTYPTF